MKTIMTTFFIDITINLIISKIFLKQLNLTLVLTKIEKAINTTEKFLFRHVKDNDVRKFIMNVDGSKASLVGSIPTDMLKQTIDQFK